MYKHCTPTNNGNGAIDLFKTKINSTYTAPGDGRVCDVADVQMVDICDFLGY